MKLFDPKHYDSITVHVTAKNVTSGIDIGASSVNRDPKSDQQDLQLIEFREGAGAVFGFPKNSCAIGHNLQLALDVKNGEEKIHLELTGKVLNVENDQSPISSVTVQFIQFVQEDWDKFLSIYTKRQEEILVFFHAVKGEE